MDPLEFFLVACKFSWTVDSLSLFPTFLASFLFSHLSRRLLLLLAAVQPLSGPTQVLYYTPDRPAHQPSRFAYSPHVLRSYRTRPRHLHTPDSTTARYLQQPTAQHG